MHSFEYRNGACVSLRRTSLPISSSMDFMAGTMTDTPMQDLPVTGRFAPSPSGRMHLGNAFSSLMAWLGARSCGGRMVLRIEDLDPRAQSRARADQIVQDLDWLGLDWDEGPVYQSERLGLYEDALARLSEQGAVYPCFCTRSQLHAASAPHASDGTYVYQGTCRNLTPREVAERSRLRPPALRLRVPEPSDPLGTIAFDDLVFGHVEEVLSRDCGDFLIRRSDGVFAYQLAVVVDDALMGVTEVVRGRDLLGSAARQTYLFSLLGYKAPVYAHVPLLVAADGRRLSKRDKDLDLGALRDAGVSSQHIIGALAHAVGLAEAGERVSPHELVSRFSWDEVARHRSDIVIGSLSEL